MRRPLVRALSSAAARSSRRATERFLRRRADAGRELDHRGQQLHLQDAGQLAALDACEQRLHPGRQRQGVRVEDQHLLLDPERPGGALAEMLLDQAPYASRAAATACASSYGFQEPRKKRRHVDQHREERGEEDEVDAQPEPGETAASVAPTQARKPRRSEDRREHAAAEDAAGLRGDARRRRPPPLPPWPLRGSTTAAGREADPAGAAHAAPRGATRCAFVRRLPGRTISTVTRPTRFGLFPRTTTTSITYRPGASGRP